MRAAVIAAACLGGIKMLTNQRTDCLAASGSGDITVGEEVADDNWDMFVHG